jgi:hypothetical protein
MTHLRRKVGTSGAVVPAVTEAFHLPTRGMSITSNITRNTYRMEAQIGEGAFGVVFGCPIQKPCLIFLAPAIARHIR